ncbi:hypothetical protein AXF42_Ash006969 [Apostasia shenzhenica]|uniref:Uncharacterized protein n=1 Tax=Apostasia shenzhenica TaxID=1088818 RepID=A0A2I0BES2_9ASPA|nr:hypothetical protein AXF42_Ash006969 [Apostasia shenzhenica]
MADLLGSGIFNVNGHRRERECRAKARLLIRSPPFPQLPTPVPFPRSISGDEAMPPRVSFAAFPNSYIAGPDLSSESSETADLRTSFSNLIGIQKGEEDEGRQRGKEDGVDDGAAFGSPARRPRPQAAAASRCRLPSQPSHRRCRHWHLHHSEQTLVLHSPEKRSERISSDADVHLAMTPLQPVVFFGFHRRMSVTAYADGLIRAYNIQTYAVHYTLQLDSTIKLLGASAFAFHPTLEWIFVGDRKGTLLAWDLSTDKPLLIGIYYLEGKTFDIGYVRSFGRPSASDTAPRISLERHFMEGHAQTGPISRLPLITVLDANHELRDLPICKPFHMELNFFSKENRVLQYPVRTFYLDGFNLMAYNLSSGSDNVYKKLYSSVPRHIDCLPVNMLYSSKQQLFLVVFELSGPSGAVHEVVLYWEHSDVQSVNRKGTSVRGRDAAFIGLNENQYAILNEEKNGLALYKLQGVAPVEQNENHDLIRDELLEENKVESDTGPIQFLFETEVNRIFGCPFDATILYAISGKYICLVKLLQEYHLSVDDGNIISTKNDGKKFIKLRRNESVYQVYWQETPRGHVAGILTSQRVLIASADMDILSMLIGALNDRLLFVNRTEIKSRQKKGVEIRSCLVGLLEPLLIGFATMQQHFEQKIDLPEVLYQITSRFDSLRVTSRSLDILANGSPVCGDLALSLSQAGPQFTQVLRCIYAIKALRFSTALSVLKDEYLRSRYYPQCPPTSHLFHRFQQLAHACIMYSQFDSAKETYEVISDFQSMLDLFICHLNPSAMRCLSERLEDAALEDYDIRRYCERILRVRSTGWTQGSIFTNFAAESMAPKGSEWGGGNWDIKTPVNMKNIPQWELAGEVMPYMRTDDGGIPSIIADHIGVYLGAIKGRGNIVEVSEQSLVKAFTTSSGENSSSVTPAPFSIEYSKSNIGDSEDGSLMDNSSELLSGAAAGAARDEQAIAEEEFKKSLYGVVDGGSSDEDEVASKTKKIHIRIREKPATSSTIDVDRLKEATKHFRISNDATRSKSISRGSQDTSLLLPFPAPSAASMTSKSADISRAAPTPAIQPSPRLGGMGVSAVPIPEDFFENTISSVQVAALLPPAGTYLSKMDEISEVENGQKRTQNQNLPNQLGISNEELPFQVAQQPGTPLDGVGLPDGGIPPQAHAQMLTPQQAMDLSSLVTPGSTSGADAFKSPPHPPSAPTAVPPGQVPHGAPASICFKIGIAHLEQNQLSDALSCFNEAFLALAKDLSKGSDIKAQAIICAQYKVAVAILQEITRLQKVQGPGVISAKEEMARLSRHLGSLPLLVKHRINCIRTAIKRNMEVQNFAYAKQMLDLLLSKAPPNKQDELRSLVDMCIKRGISNKSIDPQEDPSQFCAATLSRLSTIGHDICDLCGAKFLALSSPGCIMCGVGCIRRSDAAAAATASAPSPFG